MRTHINLIFYIFFFIACSGVVRADMLYKTECWDPNSPDPAYRAPWSASVTNGNCVQNLTSPVPSWILISCDEVAAKVFRCADSGCTFCTLLEVKTIHKCVDEPDGSAAVYKCWPGEPLYKEIFANGYAVRHDYNDQSMKWMVSAYAVAIESCYNDVSTYCGDGKPATFNMAYHYRPDCTQPYQTETHYIHQWEGNSTWMWCSNSRPKN